MIAICLHSVEEDYSTAHLNEAPVSEVLNKTYYISKWLLQLFDHNIIHFVVMSTVNSAMVVNITELLKILRCQEQHIPSKWK